jgi:uncharacterized protein (TIGR03083 family)
MNAKDILERGHQAVAKALDGLADADWATGGVCGVWSVKDVVAHLAAYEHVMAEGLGLFGGAAATPHLDEYRSQWPTYNDDKVAERHGLRPTELWAEYADAHARVAAALERIPTEKLREVGTIPWYGPQESLDDLVARLGFGHKREHAAQIKVYRDRIKR